MSAKFISHKDEHLRDLAFAVEKALTECGLDAEAYAKVKFTGYSWTDWSTGETRRSIGYDVEMNGTAGVMTVGAGTDYSPYIEFGTGAYASEGGGRMTPWVFTGPDGKTYLTHGMKPRPFIKPAIADHIEHYRDVISESLRDSLGG